jgi:menaquinol-cytochrome c reductase iron-sulfur subunit
MYVERTPPSLPGENDTGLMNCEGTMTEPRNTDPEKSEQESAEVEDGESASEISRRRFLKYVTLGIGGAAGVTVAVPVSAYFMSPGWKKGEKVPTAIASISDIPAGEPTYVTYEQRTRDGWYVSTQSKGTWIVKKDEKECVAFDPRCTHLNCPIYWDKEAEVFQCPCHTAYFDIEGKVLGGPAPRALDRLNVRTENGLIVVE